MRSITVVKNMDMNIRTWDMVLASQPKKKLKNKKGPANGCAFNGEWKKQNE